MRPAGRKAGSETGPPVYSVTKHAGFVRSLEYFKKQVFSRDVAGYKLVEPGDFAYATIHLDEGSIGIAPERALISPMYTVFSVDESRVDPGYLIRFLKSPRALSQYDRLGRGAIHRRKAIALSALGSLRVPLPGLEQQRRVAAILDHADALRVKRRRVLAHLDSLTQSIFHDMFGTPTDDRWPRVRLGDVVSRIDSGRSPNCEARPADAHEWGVLKLGAVTYGAFRSLENKALTARVGTESRHEVHSGDVLMTRKNTRELVGAVAVVKEVRPRLLLPDLIFRLHLDQERLNRDYFQALMMNPLQRPTVRDLSNGSAGSMPNISKERLTKLPLMLPPLERQLLFADCASHISAQRAAWERAFAADDKLFASLQSRAFQGQL